MDDAGRWALVQRRRAPVPDTAEAQATARATARASTPPARRAPFAPDAIEHIALTLLRRYGVVFWRLLEREAEWLPPWRDLLRVYQRLEARGQVRGGRFVNGLAGEQFALPDAIPVLRETRRRALDANDQAFVCVAATDPLNLAGTLLPGDKVPAVAGNRVLFRDGVPVATLIAGEFHYLDDHASGTVREQMRACLARRR
jgi:ATP-dependent helicase Lhr and Lhr-like helicase